jgi:class 3 adenylate cyclase
MRILFENRGTIDKCVGAMIMVFWGAPLHDPDHRAHAIDAAMSMLETVRALSPELIARFPECGVYLVYLERVLDLPTRALPEDWDGVFTHTSK